ncbi:hypothetical protein Q3V23_23060 [Streptomyces sp. VNUA116]|uniref:hypothetical protein n=1 Tax=Streptomyces sp. VNUA116 TaxID=3062449 RepID=UPI002674D610|nr:hypothetical protein [Streptomyces sp. VNUA116]WKU46706.1 hypothetical protein Q3V23_23060 [Streptomyces sp. VNUA116]
MDFRISAAEEATLFAIVEQLDEGNAPTPAELTKAVGRDASSDVRSLARKGWILVREVDGHPTVISLSPLATAAVRNLRFGQRE